MEDEAIDGVAAGGAAATTRRSTERIGARLAVARAAANLELIDIARETRVPLRHLRAIEADAHEELPAIPYAVGFVKSFARAVGLDPDDAAARFRAETTIVPHAPMPASLEPLDERRLPSRGIVLGGLVLLVVVLGGLTAYGAGWLDSAPPAATTVVATTTPLAVAPATATPAPTPAGVAPATVGVPTSGPATAPAAAAQAGPGSVSIVARDDAWFRIYRTAPETGRAQTVKTGLLAKGERYDIPAGSTGLKLWTGRAGALQLSVDGHAVPSLGGPVETVRNVDLDAAALRARIAAPAPAPAAAQ